MKKNINKNDLECLGKIKNKNKEFECDWKKRLNMSWKYVLVCVNITLCDGGVSKLTDDGLPPSSSSSFKS